MKHTGKILLAAAVIALITAVIVGVIKLAANIIGGAFELVLGIAVVAGLVLIVLWMFIYARKQNK